MQVESNTPFFTLDILCNGCGTLLFMISDPNGNICINEDGSTNNEEMNRAIYCKQCFLRGGQK